MNACERNVTYVRACVCVCVGTRVSSKAREGTRLALRSTHSDAGAQRQLALNLGRLEAFCTLHTQSNRKEGKKEQKGEEEIVGFKKGGEGWREREEREEMRGGYNERRRVGEKERRKG